MLRRIDLVDILFQHTPISYVISCEYVKYWSTLKVGSTKGLHISQGTSFFHLISVMHTSYFSSKSKPVSLIIHITKEQWP